jgi:OmcA/MtrC family decaheme c-type cytochrome
MKFAGARGITRSRVPIIAMLALAATIGLAGCEGDDGKDGADSTVPGPEGPAGPTGPAGPSVGVQKPLESCAVCHGEDRFAEAATAHTLSPIERVTDVTTELDNAGNLVVTFNVLVDGDPSADYDTLDRGYVTNNGVRTTITDSSTLTGSGPYTITVASAAVPADNSRYTFRVSIGGERSTRVYFFTDAPDSAFEPVAVSAEACSNCHGPEGIGVHGGYFQVEDGGNVCLACHGAFDGEEDIPSLVAVAHGFHSSIWEDRNGQPIEVTYPTYMNNCSVCHDDTATLAAVNAMTVTWDNCMSCHGSMASDAWDFSVETGNGYTFHLTMTEATNCAQQCHAPAAQGGFAPATVAAMHNGGVTERGGVIWNGVDTSVVEGAKIAWKIDGIVDNGTNLAISWSATYDADGAGPGAAVAVNPCNATPAVGAPAFHAIPSLPAVPPATSPTNRNNLSMLRSYAQGGDFILGTANAPGQANAVNVTTTNTTCANNVATTTIPVDDVDATVGRVALQGKPWVVAVDPADADGVMQVRAKTPTFDWNLGTSNAATARRAIADSSQCLKCHVGSLYQHGGNRVDNVDMCILCHNSASNEQNVREDYGVDASEAYDGKVGQTYEFKSMLHAIHSAGEESPIVIYRSRGIYAWAPEGTTLPNWPGTGSKPIFGSEDANGQPVMQTHNFHSPTYPRSRNECRACHAADFKDMTDQATAMATTLEAGEADADGSWIDKTDDVLQGAGAAACTSCHSSSDAKGHAYQNGWTPQAFPDGRQTIIDATN